MEPGTEDDRAEAVYKWTIRALYVVLIGGEVVWLVGRWRESAEGQVTLARWRARLARVQNCEGCRRRKEWLRQMITHPVVFDAEAIVDEAAREAEAAGDE